MVRLIGLISVFGIVAFCFAAFIDGSSSYAQADQASCPCWDGTRTPYNSIDEVIGNGDITQCDTVPQLNDNPDPNIPTYMEAFVLTDDTQAYARIDPHHYSDNPVDRTRWTTCCAGQPCDASNQVTHMPLSQAQACMQDILAYCRDYCMANPDSNLCSQ
jgi:hypothetical protein